MNTYERYKVDVPEGKSGKWKVERFIVPNETSIHSFRLAIEGRPILPGTYTRLIKDGAFDPMMSDTPAEIRDFLGFVYVAKGRCLINGLGLGVVLKAILLKPDVTDVDVVEIDEDIIRLVMPTYESDKRVHLHKGDAFTIQWPKGTRWDFAWHDIWKHICADNLPEISKLKRKYGHRVGEQMSWCEYQVRKAARSGL